MEAKDTRMDELRLWSILEDEKEKPHRSIILALKQVRDEQAEITWGKAIREVVEFMKEHDCGLDSCDMEYQVWQAKLKEWGIE